MNGRFAFLVLGLIAVSALLVQPICEAAERQGAQAHGTSRVAASGGDEGDSCCSMVAPEVLLSASPVTNAPNISVIASAVASPVFRPQLVIRSALPAAAPPLVPRYYVRSARIQR